MRIGVRWLAVVCTLSSLEARSPAIAEFRVNTYTTDDQSSPAVAAGPGGSFVVVWSNYKGYYFTGRRFELVGRRFAGSGEPLTGEFPIATSGHHDPAAVAADAAGNFVVVWVRGGFEWPGGIWGRRFNADGSARGPEFQISPPADYLDPDVSSDAAGNFVVVWAHRRNTDTPGVRARRFDSAGAPLGEELAVSTSRAVDAPKVAIDASGQVLVTWLRGSAYERRYDAVLARRYDADGNAAPEQELSASSRVGPADVAGVGAGGFVAAWVDAGGGVVARRMTATGALEPPFVVSTHSGADADVTAGLAIAETGHGAFTVAWTATDATSSPGVFAQSFDAAGDRDGGEFRVNSYTTGSQFGPALAAQPDGDLLAAWTSGLPYYLERPEPRQDGSGSGVFAQPLRDHLFADGFDSGDLSAWSYAATDDGDLRVVPRLDGEGTSYALLGEVDDTASLYVEDDSPQDEGRYRAGFEFDPSGFDPGEAAGRHRVRIFLAFEAEPTRRMVALCLRRRDGAYDLMARVRLEDRTLADTPFIPIADAPHRIELDWRRATRPDANDGSFSLWIDGVLVSHLAGLDNPSSGVDFVRLGVLAVKPGASGTLRWDEFASRRFSAIGPVAN
jgi:hypothetical protein